MARNRQLVLSLPAEGGQKVTGELQSMGTIEEVKETFSRFNTAEDGSPSRTGMVILYGPGYVVEIPAFGEEVRQAMVTVKDEDIAFPVLWRLCKKCGWKMMDPETGQSFG